MQHTLNNNRENNISATKYRKCSLYFAFLLVFLLMLCSLSGDIFKILAGFSLEQSFIYPTIRLVFFNTIYLIAKSLIVAPIVLITWNTMIARAFVCPRIRYMHAFLLIFTAYFLYSYICYFSHAFIEYVL